MDVTKATGPDNVGARLLKEAAPVISTSLCRLFNKSLSQGALPEEWKIANIIPVHKKGEKEYAENYLPISLLSVVSKVLERCVFYNIREQLYQVIKTSQHGFIRGKSCVTNLLEVLNYIGSILDVGGQVDAVYLDMSKAFDKVNHKHLLHKLRMAGFGGYPTIRTSRSTRSSANNSPQFVVPKCKTVTYQRFFMFWAARIWNHLLDELNLNTDSLSSFKLAMFEYYISSLYSRYDVEDPRSYKTICPKCNSVRSLTASLLCCM